MNIYVEFSNKDSVKKLGCKWDQEGKSWQCPYSNTNSNIKALIAMQDDGTIGFKKGVQVNGDANIDNTNSVYHRVSSGGNMYYYKVCYNGKQIYEQI